MQDRNFSRLAFWCSAGCILFGWGLATGVYHTFPYSAIRFFYDAAGQVFEERDVITGARPTPHLRPSRYDGEGVTVLDEKRSAPGLTFISGFFGNGTGMVLIRSDGSVVNRWQTHFSEIFPNPVHVQPPDRVPKTDWNLGIHGAILLPDGSAVFNFEQLGLAKIDRCGGVVWTLSRMTHHSVEPSGRGGYWVGGRRYVSEESPLAPIKAPFGEETLLRVSDEGRILDEISVPGLFFENGMLPALFVRMPGIQVPWGDLTHLNDVEELTPELAGSFPQFEAGDLLISIRELNLIMIVDPVSHEVKWQQTGPWIYQHDPDFLPAGTISVFSNNDDGTDTGSVWGGSTIIEVDPKTGETRLRYGGRSEERMFTPIRGQHNTLENGNLLISESDAGRVFEVTPDGDVVWEFINRYDEDDVALVVDAIRYPLDYFTVQDWTCGTGVD